MIAIDVAVSVTAAFWADISTPLRVAATMPYVTSVLLGCLLLSGHWLAASLLTVSQKGQVDLQSAQDALNGITLKELRR